jgi:hypothetical protein
MNVVTPEQSKKISAEIYAQACRLDQAADRLIDPWGRLHRERLQRLSEQRFAVVGCERNPGISR